MSDTVQSDIELGTQHDSDTTDKDTQATQAAAGTQSGKGKGKGKSDKRTNKPPVLFSAEQEEKMDFLRDNEILYNKDRSKREAAWDKFCEEDNLDKDACQKWFQSQHTLFRKITHMKCGQGEPQLTERQKWTRDNFDIMHHLTAKSEFRAPKGSASQASATVASSSRRETVHMEPFQDTCQLVTPQTSRTWIHIRLLPNRMLSV